MREALVELVRRDVERGQQADDVAVEAAGEEDEAALEGGVDDRLRAIRRALGELEGEHRAEPAHLADLRVRARRGRRAARGASSPSSPRAGEELGLGDDVEHGERGGARERIAAERPTETAGRHRVHDLGAAR